MSHLITIYLLQHHSLLHLRHLIDNVPFAPVVKAIVPPVDDMAPVTDTLPDRAVASLFVTAIAPVLVIAPNAIFPVVFDRMSKLPIKLPAPPPITVPLIDVGVATTAFVPPLNETLHPAFIANPLTVICDALLKPKLMSLAAVKFSPFADVINSAFPCVNSVYI